jgi:hypothetical protein
MMAPETRSGQAESVTAAARQEAERRFPHQGGECDCNAYRDGFHEGAAWQADQPVVVTAEHVEAIARAGCIEANLKTIPDVAARWDDPGEEADYTRRAAWRRTIRAALSAAPRPRRGGGVDEWSEPTDLTPHIEEQREIVETVAAAVAPEPLAPWATVDDAEAFRNWLLDDK